MTVVALGNLLKKAARLIPTVSFKYRIFKSKTVNSIGNNVPVYTEWTSARGSVQPGFGTYFNAKSISSEAMIAKQLGIDQTKNHLTIYAMDVDLTTMENKAMPDQVMYADRIYNVIKVSDWLGYDGWKCIFCTEDTRGAT